MPFDPLLMALLAGCVVVWVYVRWRHARPEFPPLMTDPDDPLMIEALAKARDSMPEFLSLARGDKDSALAKLRFVSNSQRAMFQIARRDGVKLPQKLMQLEKEYEEGQPGYDRPPGERP